MVTDAFEFPRTLLEVLDKITTNYIIAGAEVTNQTPAHINGAFLIV
jgi:hypothetical protein